jgi:hypothetical protein
MEAASSSMLSVIRGSKDAILGRLSRVLINKFGIAKYGALTSLELDSAGKKIRLSLTLKGETQPIKIEAHYRLEKQSGSSILIIESAHCSREWATLAFNDFYPPEARRIQLPPFVDMLL